MNLKVILTGALVALFSTVSVGSANAADNCHKANVTLQAHRTAHGALANVVISNQRNVPAFIAWVNEPMVTYTVVLDPYTGRLVRVPVVVYNRRLVQVYYDRVLNVYFYIGVYGQALPY